jgi:quercetin dioxygenase-like cupin family protein
LNPAPVILAPVAQAAQSDGRPVASHVLFVSESFIGVLVEVAPGGVVPLHVHEHKDEAFDVIEGEGVILVAGQEIRGTPGVLVFVPAGTRHGLRNDSSVRWLLRETVHERVYARSALKLVGRAFLKRLPLIGQRWRS